MEKCKIEYKVIHDVNFDNVDRTINEMEIEGWEFKTEESYYSRYHDDVLKRLYFERPLLPTVSTDTRENMQDAMIHSTRNNNVDKDKLLDVFTNKGITGVFNLGLETMYKYLNTTKLN